jgi:PhnB protein
MSAPYKPSGFPTVSAYVMASDARAVIEFVTKVFDATPERRIDGPDGRIRHAEMRIDDSVVMLADAHADWPSHPSWLHLYVPDVDATYQRALAAGGTSVQAPQQREGDSDRRGGVADPCGNQWWIATQLS